MCPGFVSTSDPHTAWEIGRTEISTIPTLYMKKVNPKKGKWLAQGHSAFGATVPLSLVFSCSSHHLYADFNLVFRPHILLFKKYLFIFNWWLFCNIGLISVIHQHELIIGVHMCPPSWISLSPPALSHPSKVITEPQFDFPESRPHILLDSLWTL